MGAVIGVFVAIVIVVLIICCIVKQVARKKPDTVKPNLMTHVDTDLQPTLSSIPDGDCVRLPDPDSRITNIYDNIYYNI